MISKKRQGSSKDFTDEQVMLNYRSDGKLSDADRQFINEFNELPPDSDYRIGEETLSDFAQRTGQLDERRDGYHPSSFDVLDRLESDIDDDLDMQAVNEDNLSSYGLNPFCNDYGIYTPTTDFNTYGYSNNCAYCTLAYDMRQRGYDVEASAVGKLISNTPEVIESWYEGGKISMVSPDTIEKKILETNEEGARGQFIVYWEGGGGHSLTYEVENGTVYIRDCQINKMYKLSEYPCYPYIAQSGYMRTDNLELTENALVGVKNKKKDKKEKR